MDFILEALNLKFQLVLLKGKIQNLKSRIKWSSETSATPTDKKQLPISTLR